MSDMIPISEAIRYHLQRILQERYYDVLWVSGWDLVTSLPRVQKVPWLADIIDDGVLEYWREVLSARTLTRFMRALKRLIMIYLFERRYFSSAARVLLVSEVDAASFQRVCPGASVDILHNGVDAEYFQPLGTLEEPLNIVFEGRIDFPPNTDGLLYFCSKVLPLIRKEIADVRFTIVGKSPPPEILALTNAHIEVTGYVDDVRPYLDRAAVFVCPLRKGAGIKNKVLQAWSMGKAVVATTPSTGGLATREGKNILIRDDPEGFAEAVIMLLANDSARRQLGSRARQTILEHYTWQTQVAQLERILEKTASCRG